MTRKRKTYRPHPVLHNALQIAIRGAQALSAADVALQRDGAKTALQVLDAATDDAECLHRWRSMADLCNMAETLAGMGLGAGEQADQIIRAAQAALAAMFARRQSSGAWSMSPDEREALEWVTVLHCNAQLPATSYGEFERAFVRTREVVRQAQAGNAAPGTTVLSGDIGTAGWSLGAPA